MARSSDSSESDQSHHAAQESLKSIIFIDVRGFTGTFDKGFNTISLAEFVSRFYSLIRSNFETSDIKYLGDGAMVLADTQNIEEILRRAMHLRTQFGRLCKYFSNEKGIDLSTLSLGYGIAKGDVFEVVRQSNERNMLIREHVGPKINLAARLCSIARPSGIVIHKESFPRISPSFGSRLVARSIGHLHGLESHQGIECFAERSVQVEDRVTRSLEQSVKIADMVADQLGYRYNQYTNISDVRSNGLANMTRIIDLEVFRDSLSCVDYYNIVPPGKVKRHKIDVVKISGDSSVSVKVLRSTSSMVEFLVNFTPPLTKGDRISYKITGQARYLMAIEDIVDFVKKRQWDFDEPYEFKAFLIKYPISKMNWCCPVVS